MLQKTCLKGKGVRWGEEFQAERSSSANTPKVGSLGPSIHRREGARKDVRPTGAVRSPQWKEPPSAPSNRNHACSTDTGRMGVDKGESVGLKAGSEGVA